MLGNALKTSKAGPAASVQAVIHLKQKKTSKGKQKQNSMLLKNANYQAEEKHGETMTLSIKRLSPVVICSW